MLGIRDEVSGVEVFGIRRSVRFAAVGRVGAGDRSVGREGRMGFRGVRGRRDADGAVHVHFLPERCLPLPALRS